MIHFRYTTTEEYTACGRSLRGVPDEGTPSPALPVFVDDDPRERDVQELPSPNARHSRDSNTSTQIPMTRLIAQLTLALLVLGSAAMLVLTAAAAARSTLHAAGF